VTSIGAPVRDREQAELRLIEAGFETLAAEGLAGFGVNAVARRAGCDKKLIYRYFDGPEGLLAAMGRSSGAALAAALEPHLAPPAPSYAALIGRLALALLHALRADPRARQATLVALAAPEAAAAPFRAARAAAIAGWFGRARGGLAEPAGIDAPALNAVLIAAVEALALAAGGGHAGLALASEADWRRAEAALLSLIEGAYGPAD
jgi:AcrR family transcriptional regulator